LFAFKLDNKSVWDIRFGNFKVYIYNKISNLKDNIYNKNKKQMYD
jgi:hypothetical protein